MADRDSNTPNRRPFKARKHGLSKTSEYKIWYEMRARCFNPNSPAFERYGGRGITICDHWLKFENFIADMGMRPSRTHSIERRDNDCNYEPGNCVWATRTDQARNRRSTVWLTHGGKTQTQKQWAQELGISAATISLRLKAGWTLDDVLSGEKGHIHYSAETVEAMRSFHSAGHSLTETAEHFHCSLSHTSRLIRKEARK